MRVGAVNGEHARGISRPELRISLAFCRYQPERFLFRELPGSVTIYLCEENYKSGHEIVSIRPSLLETHMIATTVPDRVLAKSHPSVIQPLSQTQTYSECNHVVRFL